MNNQHIKDYIDYYVNLKIQPEFAILLRGEWGCGKSWFIKNYLKGKSVEHLYISLNGISNFQEIEDSIFQQLHPVLSSKGMKVAGKILKGLLKTAIHIDIDGDGKKDANVSSSIPDINLGDYLKNINDKIIIFDDLERCSINIKDIMGYINQYVEVSGLKVIILSNENEIIKKTDSDDELKTAKIYKEIKEKVIGKSFDIVSDFESALNYFIEQLTNDKVKKTLIDKKYLISELYVTAGYNNLRHLKQTILDFERFIELIPDKSWKKNDLIEHIIKLYFSISFELKKGGITENEISKLFLVDNFSNNSQKEKTATQKIREKYSVFNLYYHPINFNLLINFFRFGTADKKQIEASINSSIYYQKENTLTWIKLWRYYDLDDLIFEKYTEEILKNLKKKKINNRYEILQIVGMLLNFSDSNLISLNKEQIINQGRECLETIKKEGNLKLNPNEEYPSNSSNGLTYQSLNRQEFKDFLLLASKMANDSQIEDLPRKAKGLLKKLEESVNEFGEQITLTNSRNNLYFETPIFSHIEPTEIAKSILKLNNKDKKDFSYFIEERYKHHQFNKKLVAELNILIELNEILNKEKDNKKGKISGLIIQNVILKSLERSISELKKCAG